MSTNHHWVDGEIEMVDMDNKGLLAPYATWDCCRCGEIATLGALNNPIDLMVVTMGSPLEGDRKWKTWIATPAEVNTGRLIWESGIVGDGPRDRRPDGCTADQIIRNLEAAEAQLANRKRSNRKKRKRNRK